MAKNLSDFVSLSSKLDNLNSGPYYTRFSKLDYMSLDILVFNSINLTQITLMFTYDFPLIFLRNSHFIAKVELAKELICCIYFPFMKYCKKYRE